MVRNFLLKSKNKASATNSTVPERKAAPARRSLSPWMYGLVLVGVGGLWVGAVRIFAIPEYLLPSPEKVLMRFLSSLLEGALLSHTLYTLVEVLLGLAFGAVIAAALGYRLAKAPGIERLLSPFIVASQSIPVVAIAPLLVIWFGPGLFSKILICALIVFFPILVNTIIGLRSVAEELYDLMHSLHASPQQMFWFLEVPAALPVFLGGLRVGATLSVIGAVVGELIGADRGLGYLINVARGQYDTALVFVVVFCLIGMAFSLYQIVASLERNLLGWQVRGEM